MKKKIVALLLVISILLVGTVVAYAYPEKEPPSGAPPIEHVTPTPTPLP